MNKDTLKAIEGSIEHIAEGADVSEAVNSLLGEELTNGIRNALAKGKVRVKCVKCGMPIPVYPGRYPKNCPECDEPFTPVEDNEDEGEKE